MKLLLIRHGDPDYENDCLTPTGQREAELLAARIAPLPIRDAIVSLIPQFVTTADTEEEILTLCGLLDGLLRKPVWKLVNKGDLASTELLRETLRGGCDETV